MKPALQTTLVISLILLVLWRLPVQPAEAFRMANDFFIITLGNFNSIAGQVSGSGNKLTFTSGETSPGLFTGTNYKICAGFYGGIFCNAQPTGSTTSGSFVFTVDPTSIDFGTIDPTNPVTRTNTLTVSSNQTFPYTVTAREDHPLRSVTKSFIPDTSCDTGLCDDTTATLWANTLTYGFGYRCDDVTGGDCVGDFAATNFYKAFANAELGRIGPTVMQGTTTNAGTSGQITYKINVSATQPPGAYSNTVTYIAVPSF